MALVKINIVQILENIETINDVMSKHGKEWSLVIKVLGGCQDAVEKIINYPLISKIHSVSSSHWQELKQVKLINRDIKTIVIRPSLSIYSKDIMLSGDITLDSSLASIQSLDIWANNFEKEHNIIVMVEMGDLREGIKREGLIPFYNSVFGLKNINIVGIGANIGCMFGDLPSYDKLLHLVLYSQLIEAMYHNKMEILSGGTSVTLPLLDMGEVPIGINHFRIGEAVFLGTSPYHNDVYANLNTDGFIFEANILELYRKESLPEKKARVLSDSHYELNANDYGSYKALLDFGIIDVSPKCLIPQDNEVKYFGSSSDLSVYDLGENYQCYKTGDIIRFKMSYLGLAQLMNSKYIAKFVI